MNYLLKAIIGFATLALILILVAGCEETASANAEVPGKVRLVEKSGDSALVETGIDADDPPGFINPDRNGILLQWNAELSESLKEYYVYRRSLDSLGNFQRIATVRPPDTIYTDPTTQIDTTYFYFVAAANEEGDEGERSAVEYYTLLAKPLLDFPVGNQNYTGIFQWRFSDLSAFDFIFRLEMLGVDDEYVPHTVLLENLEGNIQPTQEWTASELGLGNLTAGSYRWRIDVRVPRNDPESLRQGSESPWGTFRVQ